MAKASPLVHAFNAGEFSPLMAGRTDLKYYPNGCRRIRNFILTKQGPARRRPGTRHVAATKTAADRSWLASFEFNVEQAYVLEFGNLYIRFFSNHGVVGAPLEVVTPYAIADLTAADGTFALRFCQRGEDLYIVHNDYPTAKLTRTGAAAFTYATVLFEGGPFEDVDPDETRTVYASAATGAGITLTASAAIFLAGHVGGLFYLEQKAVNSIPQWEPGKAILVNDIRRSDGKNYIALTAANTGLVRPVHSSGAIYDGDTGVQWQFLDPGYGWVKINSIGGGGTTANVDVISRIPTNAVGVGNPSTRWAFGEFNDVNGYPTEVTFFRERLCFFRDRKSWKSVVADFENFRTKDEGGVVTAEMAITSDIVSDRSNQVEWAVPSDTALLIGTAGDETAITELTDTQAFGPGNIRQRKQSQYGSRHVKPLRVGDAVLFPQKAGRKIRNMQFSYEKSGYVAGDVTVLAEHVTKGGVIDAAFQQEPDSNAWYVRADGALLGLTFDAEQDVKGWHPHRIGGWSNAAQNEFALVEAVTTIPSPDGDRDEVWMQVQRYINGGFVRSIEWMEYHHEEGDDPEDAFYVDSGLTFDNKKAVTLTPGAGATVKGTLNVVFDAGAPIFAAGDVGRKIHYRYSVLVMPIGYRLWKKGVATITTFNSNIQVHATINSPFPSLAVIPVNGWRMTSTTISGLNHLIGQTVQVWTGGSHPDCVVDGAGVIALQYGISKAQVGLGCPAVLQPMPIDAGSADGTAKGKKQRISRCCIYFHDTLGAKYGRDEDTQMDRIVFRSGSDPMDEPPPLFTGMKPVSWPDGYDDEIGALITILQDQPGPCTVVCMTPQLTVQDSR